MHASQMGRRKAAGRPFGPPQRLAEVFEAVEVVGLECWARGPLSAASSSTEEDSAQIASKALSQVCAAGVGRVCYFGGIGHVLPILLIRQAGQPVSEMLW